MQNFIKTIISAMQSWVKGDIKESIKESTADWNQNDPNSSSYVKNRTHWEEEDFVDYLDFNIDFSNSNNVNWGQSKVGYLYEYIQDMTFIVGEEYSIIFEGKKYRCVAFKDKAFNNIVIGNGSFVANANEDNGMPFAIGNYSSGSTQAYVIVADQNIHNFSIAKKGIVVHKLDAKYLDLPDNIATVDEVMSVKNPVGNGSLSMNRNDGIMTGDYSTSLGFNTAASGVNSHSFGVGTIASRRSQFVDGEYNVQEEIYCNTDTGRVDSFAYDKKVYCSKKCTFDEKSGLYTLEEASERNFSSNAIYQAYEYYFMPDSTSGRIVYYCDYYVSIERSGQTIVVASTNGVTNAYMHKYESIYPGNERGMYLHIVGNGTSDVNRSNAHTLDWEGNAWYQGDIYLGGTGKDDEVAEKVATEEYVNTFAMAKNNPTGVGSFSMNRQEGSRIGVGSSAIGEGTIAQNLNETVIGQYNVFDIAYGPVLTSIMGQKIDKTKQICYSNEVLMDDNNKFFLVDPILTTINEAPIGVYTFLSDDETARSTSYFIIESKTEYNTSTLRVSLPTYVVREITNTHGTYAHIVGNGTSDTERSNAHTLDWEGNAWFQGEVYVGGESQSDAEAVKLAKVSDIPDVSGFATEDYVNSQIAAIPTPDVSGQIDAHNVSFGAHNDIRLLVNELTNRLNTLADSDDVTLDQMSELVEYIKSNKNLIEEITTKKVNISDIINNLTTNVDNKPLSASQGVVLKELIDAIKVPTKISELTNDSGYLTEHQSLEGLATKEYVNNLISSSGSGIQTITTPENSGLKITRTDNDVSIEFDDEIVFIFDGGNAFN